MKARSQGGFTLIELLIAGVITMLSAVFMFQALIVGEKMKRTTASSNDGLRSGVFALDQLSFWARTAGNNLAQIPGSYNCLLTAYANGVQALPQTPPPPPFDVLPTNMRMAPVMAFDNGGNPDVLVLMGGSSPSGNYAIPRGAPQVGGDAVGVTSTQGLTQGDTLLLTRFIYDTVNQSRSANCFLTQINADPSDLDANGNLLNNPIKTSGGKYSTPNGVLPTTQKFTAASLGPTPSLRAIGILTNGGRSDLVSYDLLGSHTVQPTIIAENVVDFQVLYGVDTSVTAGRSLAVNFDYYGDGTVDNWVPPTGDWSAANMQSVVSAGSQAWTGAERQRRVKAIRIALITRDTNVTREPPSRQSLALTMFSSAGAAAITRTIGSGIYDAASRYQVFETIEPIRNMSSDLSPIPDALVYPN